jgi:hypothetical protein
VAAMVSEARSGTTEAFVVLTAVSCRSPGVIYETPPKRTTAPWSLHPCSQLAMWVDTWDGKTYGCFPHTLIHTQVDTYSVPAGTTGRSRVVQHADVCPLGDMETQLTLPSNNKECKRTRPITTACCTAFYDQCAAGWAAGTDHRSQNAARHVKEELNGVGIAI